MHNSAIGPITANKFGLVVVPVCAHNCTLSLEVALGSTKLLCAADYACSSISIAAPIRHAHLLAFRARMLSEYADAEMSSMRSNSSGGSNQIIPNIRAFASQLDKKMFFI